MSILHIINAPRVRSMYLVKDLHDQVFDQSLAGFELERFAALEATLADFVTSRTLDPGYLFLLDPAPDCIWEIRAVRPEPSMRVFGAFAARDVFIATNLELRSVLAEFESEEWRRHKAIARAAWNRIFGPYMPCEETDAKSLVTGAIDGKYFK